jgi:hypothetical protein
MYTPAKRNRLHVKGAPLIELNAREQAIVSGGGGTGVGNPGTTKSNLVALVSRADKHSGWGDGTPNNSN